MAQRGVAADSLAIPAVMLEQIEALSRAGYPEEVCGLIAGRAGVARALHPGRNVAARPQAEYELDVDTLLKMIEFEAAGLELAAIYHSHPRGPETPSATDIERAYYPDAVYLICSLADRDTPVVRGFRMVAGQVREVEIIALPSPPAPSPAGA
jgi:proteasome lid subunit RPN8/RPN11